jgi:hypothetical protein
MVLGCVCLLWLFQLEQFVIGPLILGQPPRELTVSLRPRAQEQKSD